MDATSLAFIRASLGQVRIPTASDRVYKEECVLTFDAPHCPTGLYLNLSTLQSKGKGVLEHDHAKTKAPLYLHQQWTKVFRDVPAAGADATADVDVSALTVSFAEKWDWQKELRLVLMPGKQSIEIVPELPDKLHQAIAAIMASADPHAVADPYSFVQKVEVSKYAVELAYLDNGLKISPNPADWKCETTGATENLWLNLSTGYIGDGRRQVDGTGGNNGALQHFEATGSKYPLVVKLGTITPKGADVYSYAPDENDLVEDPYLAEHLARWGIDIMSMEKTAATMAEMSMDLSMKLQFDRVQESGEDLVPVEGPGFVGLYNFGNNCYINSLLQVLFSLPEFSRRYLVATDVLANRAPADPAQDFNTQMSKLATAMLTERYAALTDEEEGLMNIAPKMLKNVVASTNAEFNNTQQQDVFQYYQHFMETIQRAERRGGGGQEDLSTLFTFALEERLECKQSGQVAYKRQEGHNALLLPVPFQQFAATLSPEGVAGAEGSEPESKKAKTAPDATADVQVPFEACMEAYAAAQALEGYLSPVTSTRGEAAKTVRFASFPKYLAVQMQRFVLGPDWRATKINASVHMPNTLDLSSLKATGLQADEVAMASSSASQPAATLPDADIVASLTAMGFSENGCKRACVATENANTEAAMEWVLAHMGDADFDTPLPASAAPVPAGGAAVSYAPEAVGMLCSMGFTEKQVIKAMGECNGDADRAAEWLFSRMGTAELDDAPSAPQGESAPVAEAGSSKYELVGFITHMGPNTNCGHYVCHILKDGKWIIFNDQKVALSKSPPLDLGYVYFYRQVS